MKNLPTDLDDSQVALRIASHAALLTTTLYIGLFAFSKALPMFADIPFFEIFAKVLLVMLALMIADSRIKLAAHVSTPENIPFLSTIFFYGITLLLVYLAQIGYLVAQTVLGNPSSFVSKIEFLLGIDSFGT